MIGQWVLSARFDVYTVSNSFYMFKPAGIILLLSYFEPFGHEPLSSA